MPAAAAKIVQQGFGIDAPAGEFGDGVPGGQCCRYASDPRVRDGGEAFIL